MCDWLYSEQVALEIMARLENGMSPLAVFLEGNNRVDGHHGTLIGTLLFPFFYLFGPSWFLARFFPIGFGALTLLLTYLFCRRLFDRPTALLAISLLSIHAPYLMGTKLGERFANHAQVFSMGALLLLTAWWQNRRMLFLASGMVVLGLGFGTRMWYGWFPAALLICGVPLLMISAQRTGNKWPWGAVVKTILCGGMSFLAGYWLSSRDATATPSHVYVYRAIIDSFSPSNVNGLFYYGKTLEFAARLFNSMMNGKAFEDLLYAGGYRFLNPLAPASFWALILFATLIVLYKRDAYSGRWCFVLSLFFGMFFISPLNAIGHSELHIEPLFFLYPFPQILQAVAFISLWRNLRARIWRLFLASGLLLLAATEIRSLAGVSVFLAETGGRRNYSGAIYDLANWVKEQRAVGEDFLIFYFNLGCHLYILNEDPYFNRSTCSGVRCRLISNNPDSLMARGSEDELAGVDREIIVIESVFTDMKNYFPLFSGHAAQSGYNMSLLKRFTDDDGVPVFNAYRLIKK